MKPGNILTRSARVTIVTILLALNVIAAVVTVISAYGGMADPHLTILPALLSMMLPGFLIGDLFLMFVDFIMRKWRYAMIILVSWLVSAPQLLNYSPVNLILPSLTPAELEERTFTFLTYNVLHFWDFRGDVEGQQTNATIDYILETDADIVSMQEAEFIKQWPLWNITAEQVQQLQSRYPYRVINANNSQTVLSKFPFRFDDVPLSPDAKAHMALFVFNIRGHEVRLFDVHLESIGLSLADKELYQGLFDKAPSSETALRKELSAVRNQLISKLGAAFRKRSEQARELRHVMDSVGGESFIVAGDFNDIQGCYAIRTIMGDDMRDAYRECALGPTITYHGNRFYFRIDHVLYGGGLEAVDIERGNSPSSDHYPLLTTFLLPPAGDDSDDP